MVSAWFEFRFESLKSISVLFFLSTSWWLEALKIAQKIIRENAVDHKKKKPGLSANRPLNNWALVYNLKPDLHYKLLQHPFT